MRHGWPSELIGKMVKDPYGHKIGIVVSTIMDERGDMGWILIKMGDGRFRRFRLSEVAANGSEVIVDNTVVGKVEALRRKVALLRKESNMLMELRMDDASLMEMGKDIEDAIGSLQAEARSLLHRIDRSLEAVNRQIRDVRKGLACLAVEHEFGRVRDEVFGVLNEMLKEGLRRLMAEKKDLLSARDALLDLLEVGKAPSEVPGEKEPIEVEVEGATDVVEP
ncbi:hypothetical protein DRO32_00085 [Candidatus Bathyarchaeota archaeon]|nr:MAG: hypothetical protein DRO32_00085 [Candidatus Bathyarchaeota archaeon]